MAKTPKDTFVADVKRVASMAAEIWGACAAAGLNGDLIAADDANKAKTAAGETANSKRVTVMSMVAKLAHDNNWDIREAKLAAPIAASKNNSDVTKGTVTTFMYELVHAMHPFVREHFDGLWSIVDDAWKAEEEQTKVNANANVPVHKAWKRKYHALTLGAMKMVEDGLPCFTIADLTAHAVTCDPDHDAKKIYKRLEKIRADLAAFHVDFPADDIGHAMETLAKVTLDHLVAAQAAKRQETISEVAHINPSGLIPTVVKPEPNVNALARALNPTAKPEEPKTPEPGPTGVDIEDLMSGDNLSNLTHMAA